MEYLDIVYENAEPTGKVAERSEIHKNGLLHRTSHVWLLRRRNGRVQILLQLRSKNKESWAGCYDISSAGHIPAGDGFVESALRELQEELGIAASADELIHCGDRRFVFRYEYRGEEFTDNQISRVFALWHDIDECNITVQQSEVDSVLWMDFDECVHKVENNLFRHCIVMEELDMLRPIIENANKKGR